MPTIQQAIVSYLEEVERSKSDNTTATYKFAIDRFAEVLKSNGLDIEKEDVTTLNVVTISWFIASLDDLKPSSERLYITAVKNFFIYLKAFEFNDINVEKLNHLIRRGARKVQGRIPEYPKQEVEDLIAFVERMQIPENAGQRERLRILRDKAFIITLADTGLRVHEACKLTREDVNLEEGKAVITGKGNTRAVVRFSTRSLRALKAYLRARAELDGESGKPLAKLPVFARHDKRVGNKIKPISTNTGRNIVAERVQEALGWEMKEITPHTLRHRFVTEIVKKTGGNIRLAQILARHKNITVTQRYTHMVNEELDQGYYDVFEDN